MPIIRPMPRTSLINAGNFACSCFQFAQQVVAHLFGPVEDAVFQHDPDRCQGSRADQRIAAEGGAVGAGDKGGGNLFLGQHGADGGAAGQRLGQGHDVRGDAEMLMGKQLAGPSHADLDLVEDQQQPVPVAELAHLWQDNRGQGY